MKVGQEWYFAKMQHNIIAQYSAQSRLCMLLCILTEHDISVFTCLLVAIMWNLLPNSMILTIKNVWLLFLPC
jgi:hypothetical protein